MELLIWAAIAVLVYYLALRLGSYAIIKSWLQLKLRFSKEERP